MPPSGAMKLILRTLTTRTNPARRLKEVKPRGSEARKWPRSSAAASFDDFGKRLALLDDIGAKLGSRRGTDVFRSVNGARGNEQHIALVESHRRLPIHFIFDRTLQDVDDLLSRMPVSRERRARRE